MLRFFVVLLGCVCASVAFAESTWPVTCDEAVKDVLDNLPSSERKELAAFEKDELIFLHHGFGTAIRNDFGLWAGNSTLIESCSGRTDTHPDEVSMIIIERAWSELQK